MVSEHEKTTVSLVLGSGGARGLAHIGVIRWLEENHFRICSISGCSIGALVGGIYAAGKLDDFEQWVRSITKMDIFNLIDLSWGKGGLVKGERIINTLTRLVGDIMIEDLPIPYTAVASDIHREKELWIQSGPLFDAIRASISLPLFFTPYRVKGIDLIDGGVINPIPIAPTLVDTTDITLAVNLGGPPWEEASSLQKGPASDIKPSSVMQKKIASFIGRMKRNVLSTGSQDWSVYDIANQAFDAMQSAIARHKLSAYPPDILVEIPRNACGTLEFHKAETMIDLGYDRAKNAFSERTHHKIARRTRKRIDSSSADHVGT
jgi:NTE family protein